MSHADEPSTLRSAYDTTVGSIQKAVGSVLGSDADKAIGDVKKNQGQREYDESHASAKVGNLSVSSSGAVTHDNPDRSAGQWNQSIGAAKESVGGLVGDESLKAAGRQQNAEGRQQQLSGEVADLGHGLSNRIQGTLGGAVAGLTGDKVGQGHYDQLRAEGKSQQRGAEHDLHKQTDAAAQAQQ